MQAVVQGLIVYKLFPFSLSNLLDFGWEMKRCDQMQEESTNMQY